MQKKFYKYAYHVDKLELTYYLSVELQKKLKTIEHNEEIDVNGWRLQRQDLKDGLSKFYTHVYIVWSPGGKFLGKFYFGTISPHRQEMYLLVRNKILYVAFQLVFEFEEDIHKHYKNFRHRRVSKLDIALDTDRNIINRYMYTLRDNRLTLIVNGKKVKDRDAELRNQFIIYQGSLNDPKRYGEFVIKGYRNIAMKGYNKSHEIESNDFEKEYIQKAVGFYPIYRIEISFPTYETIKTELSMAHIKMSDEDLYRGLKDEKIRENMLEIIFNDAADRIIHITPNKSFVDFLANGKRGYTKKQKKSVSKKTPSLL